MQESACAACGYTIFRLRACWSLFLGDTTDECSPHCPDGLFPVNRLFGESSWAVRDSLGAPVWNPAVRPRGQGVFLAPGSTISGRGMPRYGSGEKSGS